MKWEIQQHLSAQEEEDWNIYQQKEGHVFNTSWFAEECRRIGYIPHYAVVGAGPSSKATSVFFTKQIGPQICGWKWATFFAEPTYSPELSLDEDTNLFSQLIDQIASFGPASIATIGSMARFSLPEGMRQRAQLTPFGTYEIDLSLTKEILWTTIHAKHRNKIRIAEKSNVKISESNDWNAFFKLLGSTLQRSGEPCPPQSYVCGVGKNLLAHQSAKLYVASLSNVWQAAALVLYTKKRAYYWYGATSASSATGAGNLLHWNIMNDLKSLGVMAYDFGGARPNVSPDSKLFGIQHFKERFGGRYRETPLWKWDIKPAHAAFLQTLQSLKKFVARAR